MARTQSPSEPAETDRIRSMLARVEAATRQAPLAAERNVELAAALLWLIDLARAVAEQG